MGNDDKSVIQVIVNMHGQLKRILNFCFTIKVLAYSDC